MSQNRGLAKLLEAQYEGKVLARRISKLAWTGQAASFLINASAAHRKLCMNIASMQDTWNRWRSAGWLLMHRQEQSQQARPAIHTATLNSSLPTH